MKVFASFNNDLSIRKTSSSGGVFSLLSSSIIRRGGIIYGASFDPHWYVIHTKVDKVEDLHRIRGSKYVFSKYLDSIDDCCEELKRGRLVLYSGTPCQIATLNKRLGGTHENLVTVEVVCHGAPKQEYWLKYLKDLCSILNKETQDIENINFRDKVTGWNSYSFTINFKNGEKYTERYWNNLYMRAFLSDLTLRESCFVCPFKYPLGSKADITLGDLWGVSQLAPEMDEELGVSLIIARTEKGESLLKASGVKEKKILNFENVVKHNPSIVKSATKPELRMVFEHKASKYPIIKALKKTLTPPLHSMVVNKIKTIMNRFLKK